MEWTEGRKLAKITCNNQDTTYEYNHEGLRIKKTLHDGSYILYDIVDGVYVGETRYNASGSVAVYIRYILDEGNAPVGISLWYPATGGWTDYHFVKNLQGDVLEVYKVSDGSLAASYTYDSWGNILSQSGSLASINPFRYRSYYYDTETWFYYLQSRYYDPAIGRFINADGVDLLGANGDFASYNLFAYCGNNPIIRKDADGYAWETIFDVLSLGASIMEVAFNPADPFAWLGLAGDAVDLIPFVTGVGETIRVLKTASKVADGTDEAIDTYRNLRRLTKGSDLEVHHIVEKRFKARAEISIDNTDNMFSIALSKTDHKAYTDEWRKALPYGNNYRKKQVLQAAIEIYAKDPRLLGAAIFTIVS